MGYKDFGTLDGANGEAPVNSITLNGNADSLDLPDASFVKDAEIGRDGMDLVLHGPKGEIIVEDYFAQAEAPTLVAPDGSALTPNLVNSFVTSNPVYADAGSMNDESPVGAVQEMSGDATVTRVDGSTETLQLGAPIYQGDIIETGDSGAVNIMFIDETSFAVSEDARLAIDEYVFDPSSAEGLTNFSVLKGKFVFTSGLIGREDPDDVHIDTPVGSIGIRGTIIAGDVDTGEITVVEGAIVLKDNFGNEVTLANQFETAQFDNANRVIHSRGQKSASDVADGYESVSKVSPNLFSSIDDAAQEGQNDAPNEAPQQMEEPTGDETLDANQDGAVDGTVDQNNDGAADGTVQDAPVLQDGTTDERGSLEPTEGETTTIVKTRTEDDVLTTDGTQTTEIKQVLTSDPLVKDVLRIDGQLTDATKTTSTTGTTSTTLSKTATTISGDTTLASKISGTTTTTTTTLTKTGTTGLTTDGVQISNELGKIGGIGDIILTTPVFDTFFTAISVQENLSSVAVGQITAINGTFNGDPILLGDAATLFDIVVSGIDANTYDIFLKSSEEFDFERMSGLDLRFSSTSADGDTVVRTFTPIVTNAQEAPIHKDQVSDEYFAVTSGQTWSYNFGHEFGDQDAGQGATLTYNLVIRDSGSPIYDSTVDASSFGAICTYITGGNFDESTGMLIINMGSITANYSNVTFEISATDTDGLTSSTATSTYTFDMFQNIGNANSTFADGGDVYFKTGGGSYFITGTTNKIFFDNNADSIAIQGNNNQLRTNGGNDTINFAVSTSANNIISLGQGNDEITIWNEDNEVYGEEGNYKFIFDLDSGAADLMNDLTNNTGMVFDGGADSTQAGQRFFINFETFAQNSVSARTFNGMGDIVQFTADGTSTTAGTGNPGLGQGSTISFTAIDNGTFKNIEILDFTNNDDNDIDIAYSDIFDMTDHKKTLVFRGDSYDTLTINAEGESITNGGTVTDATSSDVYDVYFIGDVTVLVDTQIAETVS